MRVITWSLLLSYRKLDLLSTQPAIESLRSRDWSWVSSSDLTADQLASRFTQQLVAHVDEYAPVYKITVNSLKIAPWISEDLDNSERLVWPIYKRFQ